MRRAKGRRDIGGRIDEKQKLPFWYAISCVLARNAPARTSSKRVVKAAAKTSACVDHRVMDQWPSCLHNCWEIKIVRCISRRSDDVINLNELNDTTFFEIIEIFCFRYFSNDIMGILVTGRNSNFFSSRFQQPFIFPKLRCWSCLRRGLYFAYFCSTRTIEKKISF